MSFNYKQSNQRLQDTGEMALQNVTVEEQCLTVAGNFTSPIAKFINLAENNWGCRGTVEEIVVNYVHNFKKI